MSTESLSQSEVSTPPSRRWLRRGEVAIAWICLILGGVLIASMRLHTFDEPLERDVTTYAVVGHEMLLGRSLYSDLWDHKPPGVHVTYAAAELLAGYGPREVFLLGAGSALLTLAGMFVAGWRLARSPWGGALSAAFWALICSDLWLEANQPNAESFINASLAWSFAVFLIIQERRRGWAWYVLLGLLLGLASLYKPQTVLVLAGLGLVHVFWPRPRVVIGATELAGPSALVTTRWWAFVGMLLVAAVIAAAWLAVGAYFAARGHFHDFYDAVFVFNRAYAEAVPGANAPHRDAVGVLLALGPRMVEAFKRMVDLGRAPIELGRYMLSPGSMLPLLVLAVPGLLAGLIGGPRDRWAALVGYAFTMLLSIVLPAFVFPHYFQMFLPPLVLAAGAGMAVLIAPGLRALTSRAVTLRWCVIRSIVSMAALMLCVAAAALMGRHDQILFRVSAAGWSKIKYGQIFFLTERLAHEIDRVLLPGETFYQWGTESGLYYVTHRSPPTGIFYNRPLTFGPLIPQITERALSQLERAKPEMVIVYRLPDQVGLPRSRVQDWIDQEYVPTPFQTRYADVKLFMRRGGALQARLAAQTRPSP